jgi:hypothetical protein
MNVQKPEQQKCICSKFGRTCSRMVALAGAQLKHTPAGQGWCPLSQLFFPTNEGSEGGTKTIAQKIDIAKRGKMSIDKLQARSHWVSGRAN